MLSIFKKPQTKTTVAELTAARDEIKLEPLRAALAQAEAKRRGLLLNGSDAEILAAEADVTKARLAVERADAALEELDRRVEAAKIAERDAAFLAKHAAAASSRAAAIKELEGKFARAVADIQSVLAPCVEIENEIQEVHRQKLKHVETGNAIDLAAPIPPLADWVKGTSADELPRWARIAFAERFDHFVWH